jgi:hypothetical protein
MKTKVLISTILICGCSSLGTQQDGTSQSRALSEETKNPPIVIEFRKYASSKEDSLRTTKHEIASEISDSLRLATEDCKYIRHNSIAYTWSEYKIHHPNQFGGTVDLVFEIIDSASVCIALYNSNRMRIAELFRDTLDKGKYRLSIMNSHHIFRYDVYGRPMYKMSIGDECWFWQVPK